MLCIVVGASSTQGARFGMSESVDGWATYSKSEILHLFRGERHRVVVAGWSVCSRGRE